LGSLAFAATALRQVDAGSGGSLARRAASVSPDRVSLGQPGLAVAESPTYALPRAHPAAFAAPVWESAAAGPIGFRMAGNYAAASLASRFRGLGAALLEQIGDGVNDFSQSVMQPSGGASGAALDAMARSELHAHADDQVALDITTAGGAKVEVTLGSQAGGLAVQVAVSGALSAAERDAIGKLAGSFQDAVDGLAANPPSLDLGGLTQFDPAVLASVSLHARVKPDGVHAQTLDFSADGRQRSVDASGPAGAIHVDVDMADRAILGSPAQQAQAIDGYLAQFDSARQRGHGDASLMAMLEAAFVQMNSDYGTPAPGQPAAAAGRLALNDVDRSMLTGLADFSASVTQNAKLPNPMRADEPDTFSYRVSQSTRIGGGPLDRTIAQRQHAQLSASYHRSLTPGVPLELDGTMASQNYHYERIDDEADSQAHVQYSDGILVEASLSQSADQSRHDSKYVMGKRVDETTTPSRASRSWDLLALLKPIEQASGAGVRPGAHRVAQALAAIGKLALLKTDPMQLRGAASP
jgi:hypothetical protein